MSNVADRGGARRRALVVDDDEASRWILSILLEACAFSVECVEDGAMGLQAAIAARDSSAPLDLILMDMQMPVMDGFTAAREMRKQGITASIIAVTSLCGSGDIQACLASGCDVHLAKPFSRESFGNAISSLQRAGFTLLLSQKPEALVSTRSDDRAFAPLLAQYVSRLRVVLSELEAALIRDDTVTVQKLCHRLAGTAASFGFPEITIAAKSCETVLKDLNRDANTRHAIARLMALIQSASSRPHI